MPHLRTLVVDCIPQGTSTVLASLQRALGLTSGWLHLPSVRHVVLSNIHAHLDLQILLSAVPNATSLALTSPPGDYPHLTHPSGHPLPHRTDNRMKSVTRLTILDAAPDMWKLRTFVEAKMPALRVVELTGRCDTTADLGLLKARVEVCVVSGEDLELDSVLGRMKTMDA